MGKPCPKLIAMLIEPIEGKPVLFPPGNVAVRLNREHLKAYRRAYARAATDLSGLPALRESDFDGREVKMSRSELQRLNEALARYGRPPDMETHSAFEGQERYKTALFKRLLYLS